MPAGTNVTDAATLTGANAATATGTVTYNVYSDSTCTSLVSGGSPENITTPGTLPGSQPVSLTTPGTYYWQAVYSGDSTNNGSISTCAPTGSGNEVETVTAAGPTPTTLTSSLSGGGQSGAQITVPAGTAVTDSATVAGANAATASGTVTYSVYSDSSCTNAVSTGSPKTITNPGTLPSSEPVTLTSPGTYYWQVSYSGDTLNDGSVSSCGAEKQTVAAAGKAPKVGSSGTFKSASGAPTGTITTTQGNSWIWGVGFDGAKAIKRTVGPGQKLFTQNLGTKNASWVQSTLAPTPAAGTDVTINDVAPTADPYNLVLVEIR